MLLCLLRCPCQSDAASTMGLLSPSLPKVKQARSDKTGQTKADASAVVCFLSSSLLYSTPRNAIKNLWFLSSLGQVGGGVVRVGRTMGSI